MPSRTECFFRNRIKIFVYWMQHRSLSLLFSISPCILFWYHPVYFQSYPSSWHIYSGLMRKFFRKNLLSISSLDSNHFLMFDIQDVFLVSQRKTIVALLTNYCFIKLSKFLTHIIQNVALEGTLLCCLFRLQTTDVWNFNLEFSAGYYNILYTSYLF